MAEPEIATVEDILKAGEREFDIPDLPGKRIRIRRISGVEYATLLPPLPPESADWPKPLPADGKATPEQIEQAKKAAETAERRWLESLSEEQVERRRQAFAEVDYRVLVLAAISPTLTLDDARRLGQGATLLTQQILDFSLPRKQDTKQDDKAA